MMLAQIIITIDQLGKVAMRTTLTLDADVIDKAKAVAAKRRLPFRAVINEALRIGLVEVDKAPTHRPYYTEPRAMGLRTGYNVDDIQEVLAQAEWEDFNK